MVNALGDILDWCQSHPNDPFVINLSLNGGQSSVLDDELYALQQNCHVCTSVAAGNSASNACDFSPSDASGVLSVMATDDTDSLASFTNTGPCANIAAPGVNVQSAWPYDTNGNYCTGCSAILSGTSMASPIAGGICAISMSEAIPDWIPGNENAGATLLTDELSESTAPLPLVYSLYNASSYLAPNPPQLPPVQHDAQPPPPPPPNEDFQSAPGGGDASRLDYSSSQALVALLIFGLVWWI